MQNTLLNERVEVSSKSNRSATRMVVFLLLLGFGLRIGYGVMRYRGALRRSDTAFISMWDHDAFYHVLIAHALISGKGYIVDDLPVATARHLPYVGEGALFKAPLYQFFLAGAFAVSGVSFKLWFPIQSLLGGLTAGLMALISLHAFGWWRAAWIAGVLAAVQPILVNAASQPYNESLYFCFFMAAIWAFLVWLQTERVAWAVLCGAMAGLCMLTRENASVLLLAMGLVVLATKRISLRAWAEFLVIVMVMVAMVAPWTIRNFIRTGVFVPVASIVSVDFIEGNNDCVASEGILVPYWAEGACPKVTNERNARLEDTKFDTRVPACVRKEIVSRKMTTEFLKDHSAAYIKLAVRRSWTSLLPYDPRGNQHRSERLVLVLYWLIVVPAGTIGLFAGWKLSSPGWMLISLLIVLSELSVAAVLYWSDLRFMIGTYLLLACLAGYAYDEFLRRMSQRRIAH